MKNGTLERFPIENGDFPASYVSLPEGIFFLQFLLGYHSPTQWSFEDIITTNSVVTQNFQLHRRLLGTHHRLPPFKQGKIHGKTPGCLEKRGDMLPLGLPGGVIRVATFTTPKNSGWTSAKRFKTVSNSGVFLEINNFSHFPGPHAIQWDDCRLFAIY